MTQIPLKLLEYPLDLQNYQNTLKYLKWCKYPYTSKITNIPLKITKVPTTPQKWPKSPQNPKNDQNTPKTKKMTKTPPKPKNYQNTPKTQKNDLRNLHNVMRNYLPSGSLIAYKANIFVDLICCKGFIAYNG